MKALLDDLEGCFVKLAECQHSLEQGKEENKEAYLVYIPFSTLTVVTIKCLFDSRLLSELDKVKSAAREPSLRCIFFGP